ncbi:hypothetical protein LOAG_14282 [Loa loa]|nr:hypothetical protein LOAG_14282 [Loa loa]EFO14243.1 hypothetical protein LOAG_14282 [Loa loa]
MSASIKASAQPIRLMMQKFLEEVQRMDLTPFDQNLTKDKLRQLYEARKRIIKERYRNQYWHARSSQLEMARILQQISASLKKKEEEGK